MRQTFELDQFDLKLLDLLQVNNQLTANELSERVHLSPGSCLRRIKLMREQGVITADVSHVNPQAIGRHLTMVVLVTLVQEQLDLIDEFRRSMVRTPEVMQCFYVTGSIDFVLLVTSRDMQEYEEFTNRFFFHNKNILKFETLVVMNRVKFGTSLPLF
ncbi:Lrp/AsnC family transcriptional regulator (plasmid) [Azospirillum brasilense]|jgi:Lrp/AsnC family leucine-responsive transcriptional regulator|uniref:Lrp/AsnC family transcriptional regulator n=1 Tax=Azospirillum brasilense TaxID=192 RepID=A0A4D8QNK8_AZOBR|nr:MULTISPECIES: Lrp/AsnC family transcriptional regulator [Azospirillum]MDW7554599.1 Lrp/AsnC family transcriptional regulator [Azospirillum brasilense]MDW7593883.1 Lrp/AsnC family transcriptional regulator [Azospirillum brasilense]MDW7632553.1 Lrp/AsnC family transcriptional regulator [Azospirillum brasilense]MDX5950147.1 Lrp/AsnC family transcriptional regulator [Azospirillum brasilense]NUB27167.1 winged helix-turn-helix transcriptional regulator [Azospirillum brasilense]